MITKRNVSLEKAMLLWRLAFFCKEAGDKPDAAIVEHPCKYSKTYPYDQLGYSDGACCAYWDELDQNEKIIELYNLMLLLFFRDEVPIKKIIEAYLCIPEFRNALHKSGFEQDIKEAVL